MININLLTSLSTSLGARMTRAGLNTLIGMAVVFAVLLIIAFVIYLFKFLPNKTNDNKANVKEKAVKPEVSKAQASKTTTQNTAVSADNQNSNNQDLTNNNELVAVITAAIMASMTQEGIEVPADGLFIRSIRRKITYR